MISKEKMDEIERILELARKEERTTVAVVELLFDELRGEGYTREMITNAVTKYMFGNSLVTVIDYLETHLKLHNFIYLN